MTSRYNKTIRKLGFDSGKEYRDHLARLKGFDDFNDYRNNWRKYRKSVKCEGRSLSDIIED